MITKEIGVRCERQCRAGSVPRPLSILRIAETGEAHGGFCGGI